MGNSHLIIFNFNNLFEILKEIKEIINYDLVNCRNIDELNQLNLKKLNSYVILTNNKIDDLNNLNFILLNHEPIKIQKLLELINISLVKLKYSGQSELSIKDYKLDMNARELIKNKIKIKLTQKEAEIIVYLKNSKKPASISKLQKQVWSHNSELETHTVETHVYRLRKKIFDTFGDNSFIINATDGYKLKKKKKFRC